VNKLQITEYGNLLDNRLTVEVADAGFIIEVAEPWEWNTETGFGRSGTIRLTIDQAAELARFLLQPVGIYPI